jgi:hypothetical protein
MQEFTDRLKVAASGRFVAVPSQLDIALLHMANLRTLGRYADPDVKWHGGDPSAPGACHNREQALWFMRRASGRRGVGELVDIVDAGEKVLVMMRPPSEEGESTALSANLTTFRDGKAVEMVHYSNPEDALAAAGV